MGCLVCAPNIDSELCMFDIKLRREVPFLSEEIENKILYLL